MPEMRNLRSRPVIRISLSSDGLGEASPNGAQAPGIAESQRGQVHNHRSAVTVYDTADVADRRLGADDIQLAAEIHDDLTSRPNPVAEDKQRRFLQNVVCHRDCLLSDKRCLMGQFGARGCEQGFSEGDLALV